MDPQPRRLAGTGASYFVEVTCACFFQYSRHGSKKGPGTVAGTARRVLRTTVPDPFMNHANTHPRAITEVFLCICKSFSAKGTSTVDC
jgi:hypothetical protein